PTAGATRAPTGSVSRRRRPARTPTCSRPTVRTRSSRSRGWCSSTASSSRSSRRMAEATHEPSRFTVAMPLVSGMLCGGVFLLSTLPRVHWGAMIGTGQDEWYNVIRALRALYERFDPSYFVHPALYYELSALLYGLCGTWLSMTGRIAAGAGLLDHF